MIILFAILETLRSILSIYYYIIIVSALISWVNPDPRNKIVQFLYIVTEPAYRVIRRIIPTNFGGFDFSPIILLILVQIVSKILFYAELQL